MDTIVSDRNWQTAPGPNVTSMWYSGTDYDARREQPGWDAPGGDLSATATRRNGSLTGWIAAGIAPVPNLATRLIWHQGPPVKIVKSFTPVNVTQPVAGTWVFDFGQNFAGWPESASEPVRGRGARGDYHQDAAGRIAQRRWHGQPGLSRARRQSRHKPLQRLYHVRKPGR